MFLNNPDPSVLTYKYSDNLACARQHAMWAQYTTTVELQNNNAREKLLFMFSGKEIGGSAGPGNLQWLHFHDEAEKMRNFPM